MSEPAPLARRLGAVDAVVIGLGSMIGAGVFSAFAPAAAAAGGWLLVGLALAAFVAYCNATASAQLAARYPTSGGTYVYGRERLGPWWGFLAGYGFVRSLLYAPGTIKVGPDGVELPRGLCKGAPVKVGLGDVEHAYLLRRAVPWTRAAPILVVEAGGRAFQYPRDWFLTEADQRRIVRELHARGAGREAGEAAAVESAPSDEPDEAPARADKAAAGEPA